MKLDSDGFKNVLLVLVLSWAGLLNAGNARGAESDGAGDSRLDWWRRARLGMFVHWGPVSLKGTEIGWSRAGQRRDRGDQGSEVPVDEYDSLYTRFNPTNFSAKAWVDVARAAGMKYIVFTAKHHDGFCEFDTQLTQYKITRSPFGHDVCAELARACRQQDMPLGFYYSPPDWHHPDFFTPNHARYVEYLHGQVRELLTHYGRVDILWFDTDGGQNRPETWDATGLMDMVHQLQPQILMTKRCAGLGDFDTPEQRVGTFQREPWETCMTLCQQWAWKPGDQMKSLEECLQTLVLCAGGDGNLLLNVGPMPDGRIEPRQVQRLREIGAWLAANGASIYDTRGGPFKPGAYGASTCRGRKIFLHILKWPDGPLRLPQIAARILAVHPFNGAKVQVHQTPGGIEISRTPGEPSAADTIIELSLDTEASVLPLVAEFTPGRPELRAGW